MELTDGDYLALLRLNAVPGVGPVRLRSLVGHFQSVSKVFDAPLTELTKASGIDSKTAKRIKAFSGHEDAIHQLDLLRRKGISLISYWDQDYPKALKQIFDPPAFLCIHGEVSDDDKYSIGIVGSRAPSNYGRLVAERLTKDLVDIGLTVVSGLAYGIDTVAHQSALKAGGRTLAVLGSGLDVIYPRENTRLAQRISSQGAVISEYPLGTQPDRSNFPRRNRIICGLGLGVLVVEAGEKSGALITASMCLEQNREVFAVPGNIDSPKSIGTNELIKQGAKMVTSADDILDELANHLQYLQRGAPPETSLEELSDDEKAIMMHLSHEPAHIDAISLAVGKSTSQLLALLLSLELKNVVKQLPGKLFVRL